MELVPQLVANSIIAGSIYTLVALGFNLTYSTTKFFNLAHGVLAGVGGYTVFFLIQSWDSAIPLAIITGILIAGVVGYALDILVYRPLRRRKASTMVLLIASLGAFTALQAFLAILFSSQFQTLGGVSMFRKTFTFIGGTMTGIQLFAFCSAVIAFLVLFFLFRKTLFGKAVRAIGDDEEVAKIIGIHTERTISMVFFIGSALAGLAGIIAGFDTGLEPTMGMPLLLKGIIAAIIGGVGNVYGGIVGAFALGFIENFGIWKISGEWKDAIAFGVLILFLLFRPQGIFKR